MEPDWQPELRTLRCFVCVAEEKSFTRAATRLRIAQPALSRRIQNLETDLGLLLFNRTARGVEITEAGEILLRRAYVILNQIRQAHHDVTAHGDTPRGTVTVGMPPTPGEFIAPPLLTRMKADFPEIQLHTVEGFSSELERKLTNNEISLAGSTPADNANRCPLSFRERAFGRSRLFVRSGRGAGRGFEQAEPDHSGGAHHLRRKP